MVLSCQLIVTFDYYHVVFYTLYLLHSAHSILYISVIYCFHSISFVTYLVSNTDKRPTAGTTAICWRHFPCSGGQPSSVLRGKRQIPLRYPGRRRVRSWSQTCSELEFGLSSSSLAAS